MEMKGMSKMSDRSKQLEGFLIDPRETLEFEIKEWLDLSNKEAKKTLAKAIIAMANHGGGYILIGYKDNKDDIYTPVPDSEHRPRYTTDIINNIVESFVEPKLPPCV
jgi:predicted HTH transcriptional regulator